MEEDVIIFNDGTQISGTIGTVGKIICAFLSSSFDLSTVYAVFTNPEKTSKMILRRYASDEIFEGYTEMKVLCLDVEDARITVQMGRS